MKTTRREFIRLSAAAGGAFALTTRSTTLLAEKSAKPLRILILGGNGFTGPYQVRYALSRGHKVTTFNRGTTHPGALPMEVQQLMGDRNGQLAGLQTGQWDVEGDNRATRPIASHIGRCASIEVAKCWPRANQTIRCSSSTHETWPNGQSAWREIGRLEFITQPVPPSR